MDKRNRVLEAALRLFVENGFHNTPTSKIANEAGISSGTLFYFFPTKDALVIALYLDIKSRLYNDISDSTSDQIEFKTVLKKNYETTLIWAKNHKLEFKFIEQFNTSPYLKNIGLEEIEKYIKPLKDLLQNAKNEHVLKDIDLEIMFAMISSHTFGINQYILSKELSEQNTQLIISETFDLLWDMIKK
jgi:AcrR family transcriptional regulator